MKNLYDKWGRTVILFYSFSVEVFYCFFYFPLDSIVPISPVVNFKFLLNKENVK